MAAQDHVFIKIGLAGKKADSLAVARTDRRGQPIAAFSECVLIDEPFSDLIERMKAVITPPRFSKEYVVVAHHAEVERAHLQKEHAPHASRSESEVFPGRLWLSLSQIVWPMVEAQMLASTNFDTVCSYFGVVRDGKANSDTEADCTALVRIYFEMMRRYKTSLIAEEGIRDFAGPTVDKFRKLVGF